MLSISKDEGGKDDSEHFSKDRSCGGGRYKLISSSNERYEVLPLSAVNVELPTYCG